MTTHDRMEILRTAIAEHGQAEVARRIGRSASAINQIIKGTYRGNPENVLELVAGTFGSETAQCPVMGEVSVARCAEERRRPFRATNPQAVRLFKACRRCERR